MSNSIRGVSYLVTIIVCGTFAALASSQDTEVPLRKLDAKQINNLYLTGKVWGFLKYHHPYITHGCVDWDAELIARLPELLFSKTNEDVQTALGKWVSTLDKLAEDQDCLDVENEGTPARTSEWIMDQEMLGPVLSRRLENRLSSAKSSSRQHYVSLQSGVGNPVFQNETDYSSISQLDWRYRVLALFRFWNIVEYWAPYRGLINEDFDGVLTSLIPRFYLAEDPHEYAMALMAMTATVQDGHTNLWSSINRRPPEGNANVPFAIRFVEGKPVVWRALPTSPTASESVPISDYGLEIGDVLISIDGQSIEQLVKRWSPYYGASNESSFHREIAAEMLRGPAGNFQITVNRGGQRRDVTGFRVESSHIDLAKARTHDRDGPTMQELSTGIAYVKLSTINGDEAKRFTEFMECCDSVIFDLRGYPKSFVVFEIGQYLVNSPTPFARFTVADLSRPGTFGWTEPVSLTPKEPRFDGDVIILVDEMTQSQAEYTTMAFRSAPGAIVIGSQTAGADGNVSGVPLPGGHHTLISGIGVFYPDKTPTQQVGIVPDIEVLPTTAGVRDGRDEVLEFAIEHARSKP